MDRSEITVAVAARLVAEQFPQWAELPVRPVDLGGWDNTTFRLGDQLSVRLPSGEGYVGQIDKEHRWLPALAAQVPLPIPEPVALGQPNDVYPWPWSIYRWLDGEPANVGRIADPIAFADDLAGFLATLYSIDASDGPPPGQHSASRGGPLHVFDADTRESIHLLAKEIDASAATDAWDVALASEWDRDPVWVHGDVVPSNLLVADGRLSAVIDFGCAAVGDPACDLIMAWTSFTGESHEAFRRGVPVDESTWARGRGWALWKALVTIAWARRDGRDELAVARRFGWRCSPGQIIDLVLADHKAST